MSNVADPAHQLITTEDAVQTPFKFNWVLYFIMMAISLFLVITSLLVEKRQNNKKAQSTSANPIQNEGNANGEYQAMNAGGNDDGN